METAAIVRVLEAWAPPILQESYDNAGLLTGQPGQECTGVLCALDATEEVVLEAVSKGCNLVVSHHPILFRGLKRINGSNYAERALIAAIKNDVALYALHTNLDHVIGGVNGRMASRLGLRDTAVLAPRAATLRKLCTFVPVEKAGQVREALFRAGAGQIGLYSDCSFNSPGTGTFRAGEGAHPFVGDRGFLHEEPEIKIETIFPLWQESCIIRALLETHPYEEVAYDILTLENRHSGIGAGLIGTLPESLGEAAFLDLLKEVYRVPVVRHTMPIGRPISRVAICGGAGSFLISNALAAGADAFVSADFKYHEFFDADGRSLICDIGHYESEQFTIDLIREHLQQFFPTFAVLKTERVTNPVHYT
ncbi:MAG: hypothetical protein RJA57_505 [Bacteroidota bacterium]